jgi:hypothetical protein
MIPIWPSASGPRARLAGIVLLLAVGGYGLSSPATAEEGRRLAWQAALYTGYDSNPLRLAGQERGGPFAELRLDAIGSLRLSERAGLFVDAGGRGRLHDAPLSNANLAGLDVRAGSDITLARGTRSHLLVAVGGQYGRSRLTFTDRLTGEEYVVVEDRAATPPLTRAIPDRLDADAGGAFVNFRWRVNRRLILSLDTALDRIDYVEDYLDSDVLSSLDNRRLWIEPAAQVIFAGDIRLTVAVSRSAVDYDERPARDETGQEVPGVSTSYRYTGYRLALDFHPGPRWDARLGLSGNDRDDLFAGYYGYRDLAAYAWASRPLGPKDRLQGYISVRDLDYSLATVTDSPDGERRGSEVLRGVGRYERLLSKVLTLLVEAGLQRSRNPDPLYAYDRNWSLVGIRFRQ